MFLLSAYFWAELRLRFDIDYFRTALFWLKIAEWVESNNVCSFLLSVEHDNSNRLTVWIGCDCETNYHFRDSFVFWGQLRDSAILWPHAVFQTASTLGLAKGLIQTKAEQVGPFADMDTVCSGTNSNFPSNRNMPKIVRFPHKCRQNFSSNRKTNIHLSISPKKTHHSKDFSVKNRQILSPSQWSHKEAFLFPGKMIRFACQIGTLEPESLKNIPCQNWKFISIIVFFDHIWMSVV